MTTTIKTTQAVEIARNALAEAGMGDVVLTVHRGDGRARAIRISSCFADQAEDAGRVIERVLGDHVTQPKFVRSGGFAAVWL